MFRWNKHYILQNSISPFLLEYDKKANFDNNKPELIHVNLF